MRKFLFLLLISAVSFAQTNTYEISFDNAVHHEANVKATFPNVKSHELVVSMSRSSPGRYAIHEFAKNVYGFKATDSKGNKLEVTRKDPYSWNITGHDGTVNVEYTLFGNRADGTYSQIDNTHAHLNMPATFMYAEELQYRPLEITFNSPEGSNWKVATQLKPVEGNTYMAPDMYYFMDSPTELSDFNLREFKLDGKNIRFVLHHDGTDAELDEYFNQVKRIVEQEKQVFGELPDYDYDEYTFIACYLPNVSGDGMEHRNSTILTDTQGLADGGMKGNIGTVSHEFFHILTPLNVHSEEIHYFDYNDPKMSQHLWMYVGVTEYFANLFQINQELIEKQDFYDRISGKIKTAQQFDDTMPFTEMSKNILEKPYKESYYNVYQKGALIGMALDIRLRELSDGKMGILDLMKALSDKYGMDKPFSDEELFDDIVALTYPEIRTFLETYVSGSTPNLSSFLITLNRSVL
jgi:predicted metalloprotease with PDZ domain